MGDRDKGSALGAMAADLAKQGREVALTGGAAENPGGEVVGDLFREMDAEAADYDRSTVAPKARGRGRPPGSPNRSTADLKRFLAARGYRDPLEFLAALYSADTRELAAALKGMSVATVDFDQASAVLEIQRKAAAEAVVYLHSKMPLQVQHQGEAARPLIIINEAPAGGERRGPSGGAMSAFDEVEAEVFRVSDQRVAASVAGTADASSHGSSSHEVSQVVDNKHE